MKILNFGSINIDYTYRVDAFVQPGETKQSINRTIFSGGKGFNQSISLAKAGAEVYHAGMICGTDTFLLDQLKEAGVKTDFVELVEMYTGHAIIQVDDKGQNCILLCSGANHCITEEYIDRVLNHFAQGDLLLLQNEINLVDVIIHKAHAKGMQIALNPSPIDKPLLTYPLEKVKYFLVNEIEGQQLSGSDDPEQMADCMLQKYPGSAIVLTLGKRGVWYKDEQKQARHGIYPVPVVDTTAAGDTFTGYFLSGICSALPIEAVLERASIASSISVSRNGAAASIPLVKEVEEAMRTSSLGQAELNS